ncbi:hypothetical protein PGT21_015874 [Puccinia graminis f. sp. tritici]|uniref:Dienelactone hydrolase domain-containing protein n=1 Tax=Puccinia graminis f. sp. tritici TaxID=56615 RepID=A0A5B0MK12_PUCGR|nr:hypothetical protein PGTUg99_007899 [Puccinia graminis f. sp. tritici]KAA1092843.1 hypothetical protein PGT21_015874 [Puccinia graminis f. sp. tritici]
MIKLLSFLIVLFAVPIFGKEVDNHSRCLSGFIHEGKPSGRIQSINGVNVYVANPASDDRAESQSSAEGQKAILVFPDVFGIDLINVQLITDKLATDLNTPAYLVDTFAGGDIQPNKLPVGFNLTEWQKNHRPEQVFPLIETVIKNLTAQGVERFAATGYCFGGRYVFLSSDRNWINVGSTSHPSLVQVPDDFLELREKSKAPLLINSCETDSQFGAEAQKESDEILGNGQYKPGYKRTYYPGAFHGFGVRANLSNPPEKRAFDDSYQQMVHWFDAYL